MKTRVFAFACSILVATIRFTINRAAGILACVILIAGVSSDRADQTVTLQPGYNFVSCQVVGSPDNDVNDPSFLQVPASLSENLDPPSSGTNAELYVWTCSGGIIGPYYYFTAADANTWNGTPTAGWYDMEGYLVPAPYSIWNPGRGIIICNRSGAPATLTLVGPPAVPSFPPTNYCGCNDYSLLGGQTNGNVTYQMVLGRNPVSGSQVWFYNSGSPFQLQSPNYTVDTFNGTAWSPGTPILTNAQAAFFFVPCTTNPCITMTCATNKTVPCDTNWNFDAPTDIVDNCCSNYNVSFTTVTNSGPCPWVIARTWTVSDDCSNIATCTQTVTVVANNTACIPLLSRSGLTNISVWEVTTGDYPYLFEVSPQLSSQLLPIAGELGMLNNDIATEAGEYYDVFLSTPDGIPDTNGCCITIVCNMTEARTNYHAGDNIDAVELDFADGSHLGASSIGQIQLGAGITDPILLASSGLATNILGLHDTNFTRLGYNYSSITVCFPQDCSSAKMVQCGTAWSFDLPPSSNSCCSNLDVTVLNTITNEIGCTQVITRTWEVIDCCTNKTTCSQTVTVVNTNLPVIQCPSNIVVISCVATQVFYTVTASNLCCTNVSVVCTPASGTVFAPGTTTNVHCTATDCCTNTASCDFTVTVQHPSCCQVFNTGMTGPNGDVTLNPGEADPHYLLVSSPPGEGTTAVVTANVPPNWLPNTSSSKWIASSTDTEYSSGGVYHYQLHFTLCCSNAQLVGRMAADNSAGIYLNNSPVGPVANFWTWTTINIGSGFVYGDNVLDIYATNAAGTSYNGFRAELTVCVTPLTLICASNKTVECDQSWSFDPPEVFALCCTNVIGPWLDSTSCVSNSPCLVVWQGIWKAMDGCCSNLATCTQTVTVVNTNLPVIQCPSNIVVISCVATQVFYTVTASNLCCTNVSVVCTPASGTVFAPGTTTNVHCTATDCCTNTASCDFTVTVVPDTTPPRISYYPSNFVVCIGTNGCGLMPDATAQVLATDNSGVVFITQNPPPGTLLCSNCSVTFTVTDLCSNNAYCNSYAVLQTCCATPPKDMVLWLGFDETNGVTCLNSAGGNNGNRSGGATRILGQHVKNCLCFNWGEVVVPGYDAINFGTNDFSIDAWVMWRRESPTVWPSICPLVDKVNENSYVGYDLYVADEHPGLLLGDSYWNYDYYDSAIRLPTNVWKHLAVTVERHSTTGIKFYVNGVLTDVLDPTAHTGSLSNTKDLSLGEATIMWGDPFPGCLDEVELFRRALTPDEVFNIWWAGVKGKCHPYCFVPWITSMCSNSVNVVATICNNSANEMNCIVAFQPADCGLPNSVTWTTGTTPFSYNSGPVLVPPNQCVSVPVTIIRPPGLYDDWFFGPHHVAGYKMVVTSVGCGEPFSCVGTLRDGSMFVGCYSVADPGSMVLVTNLVLKGTNTGGMRFIINDPTNAIVPVNIRVTAFDNQMMPDTNYLSLNNQPPGTPVTNQITLPPLGSANVDVWVNFAQTEPGTPFHVVLQANIGEGGAMVSLASVTVLNINPPTVGPLLNAVPGTNGQVIVQWDMINTGWLLDTLFDLHTTNWMPVNTPIIGLPDGSQGVTLSGTNSAQFFRLRQ